MGSFYSSQIKLISHQVNIQKTPSFIAVISDDSTSSYTLFIPSLFCFFYSAYILSGIIV